MKNLGKKVKQRIKRRVISWVAAGLEEYRQVPVDALVAPTALIAPEASIINSTRIRENIKVGDHSTIFGRLLTHSHGGRIHIGDWCSVGLRTEIWSSENISIGHRVLISHDVNIIDSTEHSKNIHERHLHARRFFDRAPITDASELPGVTSAPIIIEDDVWISLGVTILKGVRIGKGSIIAANSLVTKDVPAGVLYRCSVNAIMTPLEEYN